MENENQSNILNRNLKIHYDIKEILFDEIIYYHINLFNTILKRNCILYIDN